MKSVSHLNIQPKNFLFPLWSHRTSVPSWCTLCWNDSLSTCYVWDPSPYLSQARSTGTWLTPHTHAHPALRHTAGRFPPPLGGFDIYLFLCMCHTRQSKTDSSGFKLLRKEQIVWFSWAQGEFSFWASALFKSSLSKGSSGNIAQTAKSVCQEQGVS